MYKKCIASVNGWGRMVGQVARMEGRTRSVPRKREDHSTLAPHHRPPHCQPRSTLLIVRSRGQRRKGQSRLSHAWAEERPGRMRHGRRGRAQHGWASVPPTASQSIAASNVDAAWGSGHHQETHMWGAKGLPSPHATNCHAEACGPRRRRTTCACHTRDRTHTRTRGGCTEVLLT